ncbi:MAG: GNAT family N-acetyltransferase [Candidimonas sp.]
MSTTFRLIHALDELDAPSWDALAGTQPFVRHAFLNALEQSRCVAADTGWIPSHLLMHRDGRLRGAAPLYLKSHSRGEYIFDYAWADAYHRHGLDYYPKLLCAVPFTPVPGPRLLAATREDKAALAKQIAFLARSNGLSSAHVLLPCDEDEAVLREAGFMIRENVQFHWTNKGYADFDAFLAALSQPKRKKLKQDRLKVSRQGVDFAWLRGQAITHNDLAFFYDCYVQTYFEHANAPYLSLDFFERLLARMGDAMLLVLARQGGEPIAAALNVIGDGRMYGRYWGSLRHIPGLHFEACYMQGIEFCIANGLSIFEGGAQGEHKLARGMLPIATSSAHSIVDPRYAHAIADFLDRETPAVRSYIRELQAHTPFKTQG